MPPPAHAEPSRRGAWIVAALALALAALWIATIPRSPTWGWDESMHAELPAARIALLLRGGELGRALDVIGSCAQYPPVWPLVLALPQIVLGVSEPLARATCTLLWAATVFGVYLLACELVRRQPESARARFAPAPWIAMGLTALLPMPLAFAGTTFLEVPSACATVFAVRAWIVRDRKPGARADILAGAWIAAAVFTKWNYGILLLGGLGAAALIELATAARGGGALPAAKSLARCALVPALLGAWWFVLPWPLDLGLAATHRTVFLEFLRGNLDLAPTPAGKKVAFLLAYGAFTPQLLLVELAGLVAALGMLRNPAARTLALALGALALPIEWHPFHLDRFLIPWLPLFAALAAFGVARLWPARSRLVSGTVAAILLLAFGESVTMTAMAATGQLPSDPAKQDYAARVVHEQRGLLAERWLPTGGLARAEFDALLARVEREARPDERIGWIGLGNELSPAALHLGLLARGGSRERFLAAPCDSTDVTLQGADPAWSDEQLLAWAARFDVIFWTDPADLKDRSNRRFLRAYTDRLVATGRYAARALGTVAIDRGLAPRLSVTLFACRRTG